MAGALECWSSRASTDEDMVEQVLMRTHDRSETSSSSTTEAASLQLSDQSSNLSLKDTVSSSSAMQKKLQRLSRNVSEAIASLKNSLNLDSPRDSQVQLTSSQQGNCSGSKSERCRKVVWASVVRNLTQLYPGSQLPEKLVSNIRKHYDSLPLSYAQAGFDMKEVFMHIKLIEQALVDEQPAIMIQEVSDDEIQGAVYKLTFACNSSISWPVMSGALDSASICCKKIQIFEKKGFTLGVVLLLVQAGQAKSFKARIENALKSSVKKSKPTTVKLPFGLCGCQEENTRGNFGEIEEDPCEQNFRNGIENPNVKILLEMPLPTSSIVVAVDEWQTINSGGDELGKWLLNSDNLEFIDQIGPGSFKGVYKGKRVGIEKLKGCDKGNSYEFELRKDLLALMTCGHKNIHQFHGICVDENHGLCVVTKLMEGGSVNELMLKNKKLQPKEIMRIATDVAEGMRFMNDHGVAYRDLNTQRILLDRHGNACLGDMGIVTVCKSMGEASSVISSAAVATVNRTPAQANMVAPFNGLKSTSAFPVTRKANSDITSIASNGGRVQCMQVWPPTGLKKFETLSYLPELTTEQLAKEIEYLLRNKWVPCLEFELEKGWVYREHHRSPGYYDGRYWTMWKLPMFGCTMASQVLIELEEAKKAYPNSFVRIIGFDNVRQVQCISFIAAKPKGL